MTTNPSSSSRRNIEALGSATRDYRWGLMREVMDREKLDALGFMSGTFIKFASNWSLDVSLFERPTLFVFPRNGEPFAILHELSTNSLRYSRDTDSLWVSDVSFYAEHPQVINRLPLSLQWNDVVVARLESAGLQHSRIGIDGSRVGRVGGTVLGWPKVSELLPRLRLENVATACSEMLVVKHMEEIALTREAASLANWGQEHWPNVARADRLTGEVDMQLGAMLVEEAARRYPPGVELTVRCHTRSSPGTWFGDVQSAKIEAGHPLVTSIEVELNALGVMNERTRFFGKPSARQKQLFEAMHAANEAALRAAELGKPESSMGAAAQGAFARDGLTKLVLDEGPSSSKSLRERQLVIVSPGLYEWGTGGFRHGDLLLVGRSSELLTTTPKDLSTQTIL